jgi:hypothetical protein
LAGCTSPAEQAALTASPASSDAPSHAEAVAAIKAALQVRETNSGPGMTESCDAYFELLSVKVVNVRSDGAKATVAYDATVRAVYDQRATERSSNCYGSPGQRGWRKGQKAAQRQSAQFERTDGAWRLTRIQ